jgi:hypothetical protein
VKGFETERTRETADERCAERRAVVDAKRGVVAVAILVERQLALSEELKAHSAERARGFEDEHRIEGAATELDVLVAQAAIAELERVLFGATERHRNAGPRREPPALGGRSHAQ